MAKIKQPKMHKMMAEPYYPKEISLTSKELPEIKNWDVGQQYTLTLKVEQSALRKEGGQHVATFKLMHVASDSMKKKLPGKKKSMKANIAKLKKGDRYSRLSKKEAEGAKEA